MSSQQHLIPEYIKGTLNNLWNQHYAQALSNKVDYPEDYKIVRKLYDIWILEMNFICILDMA